MSEQANGNGKNRPAMVGVYVWLAGLTLTCTYGAGMLVERLNNVISVVEKENKITREAQEVQRLRMENMRVDVEALKIYNQKGRK